VSWFDYDWPVEIKLFADGLNEAFGTFGADIIKNPSGLTEAERTLFIAMQKRFYAWYNALNFLSFINTSNMDVAKSFAKQLQYYRDLYNARSRVKASGPGTDLLIPPAAAAHETKNLLKYGMIAGFATVSLVAIAKIVRG